MNGSMWTWLAVAAVAVLVIRSLFRPKPAESEPVATPSSEPPPPTKVMIDGEEVEVEPVAGEELERLALAAVEPEITAPEAETPESGKWKDVMADPASASVRRSNRSTVNLKSVASVLSQAGIGYRVAPSSESLLGIHTLQVREPDFDRALELLRSSDEEA